MLSMLSLKTFTFCLSFFAMFLGLSLQSSMEREAKALEKAIYDVDESFDYETVVPALKSAGYTDLLRELLPLAVSGWQYNAIKVMLESGVEVDDFENLSALGAAVKFIEPPMDIVELLVVDYGAVIDRNGMYYGSPLHFVVDEMKYSDNCELLELLLKGKVKLNSLFHAYFDLQEVNEEERREKASALILERMKPFKDSDEPISRGFRESLDQNSGQTLLHVACKKANYDLVKLFISKGFDINALDKDSLTPLMIVASQRVPDWDVRQRANLLRIASLLIANGAEVKIFGSDGFQAHSLAFDVGNTKLGRFLLSKMLKNSQQFQVQI